MMRRWLSLVLLLPLLLLTVARAESPLFTQGEPHASHLDYRQYFKTMTACAGGCTISFAQDAYDEQIANQVYAQISADEAVLSALGETQPHTVYVVKKPLAGMQRIGNAIYCTAAQVLDGSYRSWLAEAAFGLERWQGVGLAGWAFAEPADKAELACWYQADDQDDMLSLFPAYYVEAFATDGEQRMARQTAISLTAYIMDTAGAEAFFQAEPSAYVPGWLASLGVTRVYSAPYAGLLEGYTYTHNQFYPLIATSPKGDVFKLVPLSYDMTTPAQVHMALCELELGVDAILAGVQRDAPEWYPVLAENYAAPITYEFTENGGYSVTYQSNRRIVVGGAVSLVHETVHMMTPCETGRVSRYMDLWKVEAITMYLTANYYPGLMEPAFYLPFLQTDYIVTQTDATKQEAYLRLREMYLLYAPAPESPADVNLRLFWRAMIIVWDEMGLDRNSVSSTYVGAGSAALDEVNGNELSYEEAEWLASWLINRYGLSTFFHYCMEEGVTFEDAFGVSYQAAKEAWLESRSILD